MVVGLHDEAWNIYGNGDGKPRIDPRDGWPQHKVSFDIE